MNCVGNTSSKNNRLGMGVGHRRCLQTFDWDVGNGIEDVSKFLPINSKGYQCFLLTREHLLSFKKCVGNHDTMPESFL